ncbi:molybdopterin molybdotransferase MoeA [Roseibium aggregatum]|uniref:Molybdopterin molybdenumtransferase n=1 Tax=Roseibium aggregatum TaxID=187304 RepID=A0A939EGD6_9HYPH|nr:molybdopterin molybdotransferase MoeA [Roseibium aggregatum]MBN9672737.1 molybdopterin molybdotransferase MoeA [Roseibium aggregatum]
MKETTYAECCDSVRDKKLSTVEEAVASAVGLCSTISETEDVALPEAAGRVSFGDTISLFSLPIHEHSAVDGFALGGSGRRPFRIVGRLIAGDSVKGGRIGENEAVRIMTGAPTPSGTKAVVMQEHATVSDGAVTPTFDVPEGDNIRRAGEDVKANDILVRGGTRFDARHTALLTASGYQRVCVVRKVRVAVLSTGNELRDTGVGMGPGHIFDTNRPMLKTLLASNAVETTDLGIIRDDRDLIAQTLKEAARDHDMIVTSGGVSVGEEDHLKSAVVQAGGAIENWRMAIKPGKPVALGRIGKAVYLGLPGNPLACFVDFLLLGRPILEELCGAMRRDPLVQHARAAFSWKRRPGRQEFFPCNIVGSTEEGLPLLEKTGRAGSARLMPLIEADGLGVVGPKCAEVAPGSPLRFYPFRADMGL